MHFLARRALSLGARHRGGLGAAAAVLARPQADGGRRSEASPFLLVAAAAAAAAAATAGTHSKAEYHAPPEMDEPYFGREYDFLRIFGGTASADLAKKIGERLGPGPGDCKVGRYADGEVAVELNEHVRGKDIYLVQSGQRPVNDHLMELLLLVSTMQRASAKRVTAVIPYYPYKHHRRGVANNVELNSRFLWSAAADFGRMLEVMGVDRIIAVDLERPGSLNESNFFSPNVPVETLLTTEMFADIIGREVFTKDHTRQVVVISPSSALMKKAVQFRQTLAAFKPSAKVTTFVHADPTSGPIDVNTNELICSPSEIEGCDVVIVDELIDTGGTLVTLCAKLEAAGAKDIYVVSSHGLFNNDAMQKIDESPIKRVYVTDSVPLPKDKPVSPKIQQVSIVPHLSQMIYAEHVRSANLFEEEINIS